jgi:transcriptional regulator with XRE-family HTH domain
MTLRGRRVVRELRELRAQRGLSLEAVAKITGLSAATVSRIENREEGKLRPVNVKALLDTYGVDDEATQRLMQWTRESQQRGWWTGVDDKVMSAPYKDLAALEQEATLKRSFEPVVPGLLQTRGYAAATLLAIDPDLSDEQRADRIGIRLKRQERLGTLQLAVILPEEALLRPFGGPAVMRDQLRHLLDVTAAGLATVQLLPLSLGAHQGMLGPFSVLSFEPPDEDVAYVEASSGEACFEDEATVARFSRRHEALSAMAMDPEESRDLIAQILQDGPG